MVISIRPEFAFAILEGCKQVELRRTRPLTSSGDLMLLYATAPTSAIVGWARIEEVLEREVEILKEEVLSASSVEERAFDEYFQGVSVGYGIKLTRVGRFSVPVHLDVLRQFDDWRPAQTWRYIDCGKLPAFLGSGEIAGEIPS